MIFGAGEWGRMAYCYYKNVCDIVGYLDNDSRIWNTYIDGVPIYSPDFLKNNSVGIIVANKRYQKEIKEQLRKCYGIKEVVIFEIIESVWELYDNDKIINNDQLIVSFSDGLGNQMFQYALYCNLKSIGRNVKADLSAYSKPGMMPFVLEKVFPNIKLDLANFHMKEIYQRNRNVYIEQPPNNIGKKVYDESIFDMEVGYIEGYHTSYKYAESIKKNLVNDFKFYVNVDSELNKFVNLEIKENTVSVQVRRGDFLNSKNYREIGCHCDEAYYKKAMDLMQQKVPKAKFVFMSNDIEWVKANLGHETDIFIEKKMFSNYQDWYDMYIMSKCKYNIIPNSTFGWWGAWLNMDPDKIVIAPKRWRTNWESTDWCPPDWILI